MKISKKTAFLVKRLCRWRSIHGLSKLPPPTPAETAWTWAKPTIVYHNTTNIKKVCQVWTWRAFRYGLYRIFRKKCVFSRFLVNFANFRGLGTSNFSKFKNIFIEHTSLVDILSGMGSFIFSAQLVLLQISKTWG